MSDRVLDSPLQNDVYYVLKKVISEITFLNLDLFKIILHIINEAKFL